MAAKKTVAKKTVARKAVARKASSSGAAKGGAIAGLPLTREEIEPLLGEEMPLFAYIYWNSFQSDLDLPAMKKVLEAHLDELPGARGVILQDLPPPDGPQVTVQIAGKQVSATIKRLRTNPKRWSLKASFRGVGEAWGSNHAVFLWLARTMLPWVAARDVKREPLPHALTRYSKG